ncbi:MAG: SAM hydrolase/SAM-dependent halogenase family protein [Candidatus Nitrospinota bacterium M3_3B_026]
MPIVTFTTDFGTSDPFVGIMKGVALGVEPSMTCVDITHEISPQNIRQAAYVISSAVAFFPKGSIHLAVVDPGVGSERRPIVFEAGGHYFTGPDNGIFTEIIKRLHPAAVYEIINPDYMLSPVSGTFHGRDIFAPAAGWLARGAPPSSFGPITPEPVILDLPEPVRSAPNMIEGEVIHVDHFGNAITNITRTLVEKIQKELDTTTMEIQVNGQVVESLAACYSAAERERGLSAVFGSWDTIELFVMNQNAAHIYNISVGDSVETRFY